MLHVVVVLPIDDIDSTDEVLRAELEVATAATADAESTSGLAIDLADEDHPVEQEDVAFGKPSSVLYEDVEFSLCNANVKNCS